MLARHATGGAEFYFVFLVETKSVFLSNELKYPKNFHVTRLILFNTTNAFPLNAESVLN